MFELYIYSFGRKKYRFVLDPVKPENKFSKWTFIYISEYCFYIFIVTLGMVLNYKRELFYLINFIVDILACFGIVYLTFKSMFVPVLKPKLRKATKAILVKRDFKLSQRIKPFMKQPIETRIPKTKYHLSKTKTFTITKSNYFIEHPWLSILILLIFNFIFILCINFYIISLHQLLSGRFYARIFWFCLIPLSILIFIRIKFIPKQSKKKLNVSYQIFYYIISGIIGAVIIISIHIFCVITFSIPYLESALPYIINNLNLDTYGFLTILIFAIWYEILFRGIILPVFISRYKKYKAFSLSICTFFLYYLISGIILPRGNWIVLNQFIFFILMQLIYILIINGMLSFLYIWQNNIYPGLIVHTMTILAGVFPYFYFGIYIFFPNFL
jgi:membrane protease YdiL (CAAX protease family)